MDKLRWIEGNDRQIHPPCGGPINRLEFPLEDVSDRDDETVAVACAKCRVLLWVDIGTPYDGFPAIENKAIEGLDGYPEYLKWKEQRRVYWARKDQINRNICHGPPFESDDIDF